MKEYNGEEFRAVWKEGMEWRARFKSDPADYSRNPWHNPDNHRPIWLKDLYYQLRDEVEPKQEDIINKPNHYHIKVNGIELDCRAVQKELGMYEHHCIASAFAYLWRCLHKENTLKDLEKAVNFLNEEIAYRKAQGEK